MREQQATALMLAAKIDANHQEIVAALQQLGATVQDLSQVAKGCPDILVGWRGVNYLMEIKPSRKRNYKDGGLNSKQVKWHEKWRGQKAVIYDEFEAFELMGVTQADYQGI